MRILIVGAGDIGFQLSKRLSQDGYDITMVKGIKTALFGGDGLFYATMTGPGKVWIQSLPFARLAGRMLAAAMPGEEQARQREGTRVRIGRGKATEPRPEAARPEVQGE